MIYPLSECLIMWLLDIDKPSQGLAKYIRQKKKTKTGRKVAYVTVKNITDNFMTNKKLTGKKFVNRLRLALLGR